MTNFIKWFLSFLFFEFKYFCYDFLIYWSYSNTSSKHQHGGTILEESSKSGMKLMSPPIMSSSSDSKGVLQNLTNVGHIIFINLKPHLSKGKFNTFLTRNKSMNLNRQLRGAFCGQIASEIWIAISKYPFQNCLKSNSRDYRLLDTEVEVHRKVITCCIT